MFRREDAFQRLPERNQDYYGRAPMPEYDTGVQGCLNLDIPPRKKPVTDLSFGQRFDIWMVNEGPRVIFFSLYVLSHIMIFALTFINFQFLESQSGADGLLGFTYPTARAAALVLHVDVGIILFTVCRNMISFLRCTPLNRVIPFDKNITFHKAIGWSLLFFSLVHTFAHYVNLYELSQSKLADQSYAWYMFLSGPGWTGHVMIVVLILMVATALDKPKSKNFERFWYTHHLFLFFFGCWTIHGAYCMVRPNAAPFCNNIAVFWKYWTWSGFCYASERIFREIRARHKTYISKVVLHPSKVVEVQIKKEHCSPKAGQYIFLCCPEVSLFQYHPFTLTSAPEEDFISVHIRMVGNWTQSFARQLGCDLDSKNPAKDSTPVRTVLPRVMVDGPFGSASEDVFDFEAVMLFGAGIGVTPFASILKSIWYRTNTPGGHSRLRKVYFFWTCRAKDDFEWFQSLLASIEAQDNKNFIEIHVYLTGRLKADEAQNVVINDHRGVQDAVTGLRSPTHYGRPNLDRVFEAVKDRHPRTDVGVFFCGPKVLGHALHLACSRWTEGKNNEDGTNFFWNKENF